ncbi:MAG: exopolysaccharide biosynthesis protein [Steroidobacteraceae bacterium]|nr:exopolysaccharide biosynthesis protein [Steroidobacteraceae bacterium]
MTTAHLHSPDSSLSVAFERAALEIRTHTVTVRELLELIGEQGLLLFSAFLAIPFLLPVAIPGTSTVFGILMVLVGFGVATDSLPLVPQRLLDHPLGSHHVLPALQKGAETFRRFERLIRPRVLVLTTSRLANFLNGMVIVAAALVLMLPLPLVPFTNTIPALAVVLLSIGMVERDGIVIVLGYLATLAGALYCGTIAWAAWKAGSGVTEWLRDTLNF